MKAEIRLFLQFFGTNLLPARGVEQRAGPELALRAMPPLASAA
jgi:hypothetical protein